MKYTIQPPDQHPIGLEHLRRCFKPAWIQTASRAWGFRCSRRLALPAAGSLTLALAVAMGGCGSPTGAATEKQATAISPPRAATETVRPAVSSGTGEPAPTLTLSAATAPGTPIAPGEPYVPPESIDTEIRRLTVNFDNERVNIKNGAKVMLGNGLAVEIFADPYPPTTLTVWVDFYLTRDGEPLDDEGMGIDYDMLAMVHGPFWGEAENLGGGHYLFKLDYIMFGPWEQTITVRIGLQRIRIPLIISAHP